MTYFSIFTVGLMAGAALGWIEAWREMGSAPEPPDPPEHECPYCGETLRAITVQDADVPFPAGARWICPECKPICYFADLLSAKPSSIDEV